MDTSTLPRTRYREGITACDVIEWLRTHSYVLYKAPMDVRTSRLMLTSKLKTWKRDPERFSIGVVHYDSSGYRLRFRLDNSHLDRIRIPHKFWWHGITATACHEFRLSDGCISYDRRGHLLKYGVWTGREQRAVTITSTKISLHQSNGYILTFDKLEHAVNFCKHQNIRLTVSRGKRVRVLVHERPERG